jgi:hypothetical protein
MNMENRDEIRLQFKGEEYLVKTLIGLMRQAPVIEVKPEDLNPIDPTGADSQNFGVCYAPAAPELQYGEIAFFKQEGKYTVLLGKGSVQKAFEQGAATVKGRLISSPGLKKIRIITSSPSEVVVPSTQQIRSSEYFKRDNSNRPYRSERPPREGARPYSNRYNPNSNGASTRRDFHKS